MKPLGTHPSGWALFAAARHEDARGWLAEAWRLDALRAHAGAVTIVQQNASFSRRHVLRGLHYQAGAPQGKLVQVLLGRVHDVIVDLRPESPSFGVPFAFDLRDTDARALWVPPGFAHGFLALEDSLLAYGLTQAWEAGLDRAIRWDSPALAIDWPLGGAQPLLSERDRAAPPFGAHGQ